MTLAKTVGYAILDKTTGQWLYDEADGPLPNSMTEAMLLVLQAGLDLADVKIVPLGGENA